MKTILLAVLAFSLIGSTADAQLLRRISMASGCSQSIRVTSNTSCGGQSLTAGNYIGIAGWTPPVRTVAPVRRVIRAVAPPIGVPQIFAPRATSNCPTCPVRVSVPVTSKVTQSQPMSGYHAHRTMDGRTIVHHDSNFGDPVAHRGIAYPWLKIPMPEMVSIF